MKTDPSGTPLDLPGLRKLAAKATPAPWGQEDETNPEMITAGKPNGAFRYIGSDYGDNDHDQPFVVALRNQFGALDAALTQAAEALRLMRKSHGAHGPCRSNGCSECRYADEKARAALRALGMDP